MLTNNEDLLHPYSCQLDGSSPREDDCRYGWEMRSTSNDPSPFQHAICNGNRGSRCPIAAGRLPSGPEEYGCLQSGLILLRVHATQACTLENIISGFGRQVEAPQAGLALQSAMNSMDQLHRPLGSIHATQLVVG